MFVNEEGAILVGERRGRIWVARLRHWQQGEPESVTFDWDWVLAREERYGDVLGFFHTHPPGLLTPSRRDVRTMQAWTSCFGKPLLCIIESVGTLAGYCFVPDATVGEPLPEVQRFPRGLLVAVG